MENRPSARSSRSNWSAERIRGVALALLVVGGVLGGLVAGAAAITDGQSPAVAQALTGGAQAGPTPVDSCQVIDEPGTYELADDVQSDGGACIHVRSNDVTFDGNGHTVAGTGDDADGSVGILVFNGSEDGLERQGDHLNNVTVRNVTVANHAHGVRLGQIVGSGPTVTLENVTATDNGDGVVGYGVGESTFDGVTASDSTRSGVIVWETTFLTVSDLTVSDNGVNGLVLDQSVLDGTFEGVTATNNGRYGVVVNTGSADNEITNAYVAGNGEAGVRFSDSAGTDLRDVTVEDNDGPGVYSDFGDADSVTNATVADNVVAYDSADDQPRYGVVAEDFRLGSGVVATFETNVDSLDDADDAPSLPEDVTAAGPAVNLTVDDGDAEPNATLRFPLDDAAASGDADPTVWRYADGTWHEVADASVEGDTVTATVSDGGTVVPVVTSDDAPPEDPAGPDDGEQLDVTVDGTEFDCTVAVDGPLPADEVPGLPADGSAGDDPDGVYRVTGTCAESGDGDGETAFVTYVSDPPASLASGATNATVVPADESAGSE